MALTTPFVQQYEVGDTV